MTNDLPAHSVIRPLSVKDIDQVEELENLSFNEQERCSREKLIYRLKACPELSAGVFIRKFKPLEDEKEEKEEKAEEKVNEHIEDRDEDYEDIDTDEEEYLKEEMEFQKSLPRGTSSLESEYLIGHILATKINGDYITDESMEMPDLDEYGRVKDPKSDKRGHREEGRTIGVHSVCIRPDYQGKSIGTLMLKDYIQRITTQHIADRIALICHDHLVPFYQKLDFHDSGASDCQHGGGNWRDLGLPLSEYDDEDDDME